MMFAVAMNSRTDPVVNMAWPVVAQYRAVVEVRRKTKGEQKGHNLWNMWNNGRRRIGNSFGDANQLMIIFGWNCKPTQRPLSVTEAPPFCRSVSKAQKTQNSFATFFSIYAAVTRRFRGHDAAVPADFVSFQLFAWINFRTVLRIHSREYMWHQNR